MQSEFASAFQQLDAVIADAQHLWRPQPFIQRELPWFTRCPQLKDALLGLTDDEAAVLYSNPDARVEWFRQFIPDLCDVLFAYEPEMIRSEDIQSFDHHDCVDIPGRKLQQIQAFAGALGKPDLPVVDWCAGKGHLSRLIQKQCQQPVYCLEWDQALVDAGIKLADKQKQELRYHQHDVMQPLPDVCSDSSKLHVGLHACGELHVSLLKHVSNSQSKAFALSPCCYHKISDEYYSPLSVQAKKSVLKLDKAALHLAVQEMVTARQGETRLYEQEKIWRLGFDLLQRDIRQSDEYLPVPSCKTALLRQSFPAFCRWAAEKRGLLLPEAMDYEAYIEAGRQRYREVYRLELLRRLFNRPLELWLVLDRALYLEEQAYHVRVEIFCEAQVTPRNILIRGERIKG